MIGDWTIVKVDARHFLKHDCIDKDGVTYPYGYLNREGTWYCERCHTEAPQEIQDVANLANCMTVIIYPRSEMVPR